MRRWIVSICIAVTFAVGPLCAVGNDASDEKVGNARNFVKNFYDWYVPLYNNFDSRQAKNDENSPPMRVAIYRHASLFSPALLKALREDDNAQRRAKEIVGIDFDPFLIKAVVDTAGSRPVFVDFRFPDGNRLMNILQQLAKGR